MKQQEGEAERKRRFFSRQKKAFGRIQSEETELSVPRNLQEGERQRLCKRGSQPPRESSPLFSGEEAVQGCRGKRTKVPRCPRRATVARRRLVSDAGAPFVSWRGKTSRRSRRSSRKSEL
ncbi:hypothetical protein TGRH88_002050 [Toxoplasma gondii]|uniref:Uncharacterized protein n=1 Tax=Toxoplasma gondii TaxID=5811 RepID=A0A7J6KGE7_TOXGO|nr:hypothetical protein TGRH88_002050 [Toxoplasma gondii]